MQTILVTGSNGVLGSAFEAIQYNYPQYQFTFWTSIDCNLLVETDTLALISYYKPDYIIHTAALSGGVGLAKQHPAKLLHDNVKMDLNVMESARISGVKKVIMTLSGGMYWPFDTRLIEENDIHRFPPHESNYSYAFAKRLIEPMIRAYREEYGLNAIGLVPDAIYGENDYFGEGCNMTAALVAKFFQALCTGEGVEIWGDGSQLRQLTYSKDLARAYMWCLQNYDSTDILNIGTSELLRVSEVVGTLAELFGIDKARIHYDTTKPIGPYMKALDNSKFTALSGFSYTPFEEGIQNMVDWYVNQKPEDLRTGSKVRN